MCKKITTFHPKYNNLVAYYRFDEGTGNTAFNFKGPGTNGTLMNNPLWVTSGAAIGNASAYNYSATPTATLAHPQGENLQVTTTAGSPAGVQLYRVDSLPNTNNGITGLATNNRYFGVFVIGGTAPQYTATYNYNGNPLVNAGNENNLALYKRNNNADITWVNSSAVLNTTTKTLTATGQFTEYILGLSSGALPVSLLSFTAQKNRNTVVLNWATSSEQNNKGFEVQRSSDGINFNRIGWVDGVGNSSSLQNYSFTDAAPAKGKNFYRLNQVDIDGKAKLSAIRKIDFNSPFDITIYPNPATDVLNVQVSKNISGIKIVDAQGKLIWQQENNTGLLSIPVSVQKLTAGLYILEVSDAAGNKQMKKFIKE
jgi:hypothetical protein